MAVPKSIASIKRFGVRYGRTSKHKFGSVESMQRKKYKCPSCSKPTMKRVSAGIWECGKCHTKMASRAYTVAKPKSMKDMIAEASTEEPVEEIEETETSEENEEISEEKGEA